MIGKDALQYQFELGKSQQTFIESPNEPNTVYYRAFDGSLVKLETPLEPLSTTVYTVDSLWAAIGRTGGGVVEGSQMPAGDGVMIQPSMVLVSEVKAVGVVEFRTHRALYTLNLPKHPVYKLLSELKATRSYDQRGLVRLLAAQLAGHVEEDMTNQIRVLRTRKGGSSESVAQHGRGGFSVQAYEEADAAAGQRPPERLKVTFPVFDTPDFRDHKAIVDVLLEWVIGEDGKWSFELTTVHDDLANALDGALENVVSRIRDEALADVPVLAASL